MRTSIDALRSLKRYVAVALGPDWEVRLQAEEGTFKRPQAIILEPPGGAQVTGSAHSSDLVQTFVVHIFPERGNTVMESLTGAADVEEIIFNAFRSGVGKGRVARMPLYDYEAVGPEEPSDARRGTDFAQVLALSVERKQSPSDELNYTVTTEVRLGWRRNAGLPSSGRVATEVRTTQIGS